MSGHATVHESITGDKKTKREQNYLELRAVTTLSPAVDNHERSRVHKISSAFSASRPSFLVVDKPVIGCGSFA